MGWGLVVFTTYIHFMIVYSGPNRSTRHVRLIKNVPRTIIRLRSHGWIMVRTGLYIVAILYHGNWGVLWCSGCSIAHNPGSLAKRYAIGVVYASSPENNASMVLWGRNSTISRGSLYGPRFIRFHLQVSVNKQLSRHFRTRSDVFECVLSY